MSTVRAAAIDCGTNSIRLLVADVDPATGRATDVVRELRIVRLGQGVDATGAFAPDALDRTFAACREYAALLAAAGHPPLRFVATSASRDVSNRAAFVAGVGAILGVQPEVIDGQEEGALSFVGATAGLPAGTSPPYLVVDIGGGSTEFVRGEAGPAQRVSVDIGCVRMTERHLAADPPTAAQVAAATTDIDAAIARAGAVVPLGLDDGGTLVGLAGTVTTVAAIALGLPGYDAARIHHSRIPAAAVRAISDQLLAMPRAERLAMPVMVEGREDVIGAGALVLRRIVEATGAAEVLVSEHDLLDGMVLALAGGSG
ncbi:MAG: Ppx/GppA family phosphatase [Candidatus Nanopelagicales bacterium]|nr:Ppx/GppA family phosphatase [Candidatus Nanopelagicales bacterium]